MSSTDRGARYASYWTSSENTNRPEDPSVLDAKRKERTSYYKDIARDYYDLATDNLEGGWTQHFHFCPFPNPDEGIEAALTRHEHFLALVMGLKPGMKGLDAGCGVGGPSREIARFANVHITGVSINRLHVERATDYASSYDLGEKLKYIEGDFMVCMCKMHTKARVSSGSGSVYSTDCDRNCLSQTTVLTSCMQSRPLSMRPTSWPATLR